MRSKRVMVAIDDSDESFYALRWALDHLIGLSGGNVGSTEEVPDSVTLVHVYSPFQQYAYPAAAGPALFATPAVMATSAMESVRKAQEENVAALLCRASKVCTERGVKAETLILKGEAKDMICHATEETQVDLLVIGSRGLGMVKRALLGSVSDYCAHHAKCPILIVKPPKELKK